MAHEQYTENNTSHRAASIKTPDTNNLQPDNSLLHESSRVNTVDSMPSLQPDELLSHKSEILHASTLSTTDWNTEWKLMQRVRRRFDDAQYWNKRSKSFGSKDAPSPYVKAFLEKTDIKEGDVVFDMGCGTGSLAVPLARAGHHVIAGDFSHGMLDQAQERQKTAGVCGIDFKLMRWDDNWDALGLTEESVDVAIASRSISCYDLGSALDKLHRVARRRCCVTVACGCSPRMDERVLAACGIHNEQGSDAQYVWNILFNKGRLATVDYIRSARKDTFNTDTEAFDDFSRMIDEATANSTQDARAAKKQLRTWLDHNLIENETAGMPDHKGNIEGQLRLCKARIITWAFIAWNK